MTKVSRILLLLVPVCSVVTQCSVQTVILRMKALLCACMLQRLHWRRVRHTPYSRGPPWSPPHAPQGTPTLRLIPPLGNKDAKNPGSLCKLKWVQYVRQAKARPQIYNRNLSGCPAVQQLFVRQQLWLWCLYVGTRVSRNILRCVVQPFLGTVQLAPTGLSLITSRRYVCTTVGLYVDVTARWSPGQDDVVVEACSLVNRDKEDQRLPQLFEQFSHQE